MKTKTINGEDDPFGTATSGNTIQFSIKSMKIVGHENATDIPVLLPDPDGDFGKTNEITIVGIKVINVRNTMESELSFDANGSQSKIGQYKIEFDNGINRLENDVEYRSQMHNLVVEVFNSRGLTVTNIQVFPKDNSEWSTSPKSIENSRVIFDLSNWGLTTSDFFDLVFVAEITAAEGIKGRKDVSVNFVSISYDDDYIFEESILGPVVSKEF